MLVTSLPLCGNAFTTMRYAHHRIAVAESPCIFHCSLRTLRGSVQLVQRVQVFWVYYVPNIVAFWQICAKMSLFSALMCVNPQVQNTSSPSDRCRSGCCVVFEVVSLRQADSLVRTNACTCSALCAEIGVNRIDVALGDSLNGALANTCTASNAVFTNYVCHNAFLFKLLIIIFSVSGCNSIVPVRDNFAAGPPLLWCKDTFFILIYLKMMRGFSLFIHFLTLLQVMMQ